VKNADDFGDTFTDFVFVVRSRARQSFRPLPQLLLPVVVSVTSDTRTTLVSVMSWA
jgi:hypothetical protein